jgi:hypothetical protein
MNLLYIGKRDNEFKFDDRVNYCQVEFCKGESLTKIKRRLENVLEKVEPHATKLTDCVLDSNKPFSTTDGIFCLKWRNEEI